MLFSTELVAFCLAVFFIVSFVRYVWTRFISRGSVPELLPWAGVEDDGFFSIARATLRSFLNTRDLLQEGYHKVNSFCTCLPYLD
jgi:hypothetical protein